ncbi:MAG: hypothetical protein JSV42_06785, partial [Chloroflexota bacterium]
PVYAADSPVEQPESSALSPGAETAVCTPDAAGMRAYWPFDDPLSTTSFADVIDNPVFNDGACVGDTCPASTSDSKVGSAFVFDSNDEIHVVDTSGLDFTIAGDMAIETWVKTSQDCSSRVVFVGRYEGLDLAAWWLGCIENNKAAFHMRDSNGNKYMVTSTTTINDGQWHHIVGTRDGTANLNNIYVDGVLEDSLTPNFTGSLDFLAKDVTIAHYDSPAPFYWLNGVLDEMALYDQALPGSEVTRHYLNGQGQSYCNDDLPIPGGITFFTNVDGSLPFTENQLLTKDVAPDGGLHLISIAPTSLNGGTITGSGPFVYNPPPGFIGTDKFSYIIADVDNDQAAAEATVIVQDIVATIYLPILFKNH